MKRNKGQGKSRTLILTRTQVRLLDRLAIERIGIPGLLLMENAGKGAAYINWAFRLSGQRINEH